MKRQLIIVYAFLFSPGRDISRDRKNLKELEEEILFIQKEGRVAPIDSTVRLFKALSMVDKNRLRALIKKLKRKNYGQLDEKIQSLEKLSFYLSEMGKGGDIRTESGSVNFETLWIKDKTALNWLEIYNKELYNELWRFVSGNVQELRNELSLILN